MERLQKVIANRGFTSRRKAEELILKGKVKVDGMIIRELGTKVDENAIIEIDGNVLEKDDKVYYIINKPRGIVTTTSDEKNRKTVIDLIETDIRIYPVGRLDYDTTGLLLLTNDGELTNLLTHPKNKINKVYVAKIKGVLKKEDIISLTKGIDLDGFKTSPAKVKVKKYDYKTNISFVELTIHEGKNHQVKRMFEKLGFDVIKLKRESVGFLKLDNLKSGEYRKLNKKEVSKLYNLGVNNE